MKVEAPVSTTNVPTSFRNRSISRSPPFYSSPFSDCLFPANENRVGFVPTVSHLRADRGHHCSRRPLVEVARTPRIPFLFPSCVARLHGVSCGPDELLC